MNEVQSLQKPVTLEQILALDLPPIIVWAAPVMLSLVAAEWILSYYKKKDFYDGKDTLAAAVVGLVNVALSFLIKSINFGIIIFFWNLVPWTIPHTWWSYVLCLIFIDFWRYWAHRVAHESRFWWATHVTHHSSKKYNWSVSFRLGWTQYIKIIFFVPVALAGFDPFVFFICHQIEVLYQFWIHSEYIRKLPKPIEYIFTTPSHHRVHHAVNDHYMDKNYGSTFIIWDRIFGTFQPEGEQAIYGITKPVNSYNPVYLCFHEWIDIFKDVRRSKSLKEAYQMIFTRPSRLKEVKLRYPHQKE
ncbi:MAG: sterol desaturase family protein [Bacteroidota bacterium]